VLGVTLSTADGFAASTDKAKRVGYAGGMARNTDTAAAMLRMTSADLLRFGVINGVLAESGGAQNDPGKDEPVVYTLSFDLNYTGAPNPPANQQIGEGKYAKRLQSYLQHGRRYSCPSGSGWPIRGLREESCGY
jgi:hypothetical protein